MQTSIRPMRVSLGNIAPVGLMALASVVAGCATVGQANPANCTTAAHDPHPSSHQPGRINAEVRQTCPVVVDDISAEAQLWEDRFWGWDRIGEKGFALPKRGTKASAFANAECRVNDIRVTGFGHYSWNGAHIQSIEVANIKHVGC